LNSPVGKLTLHVMYCNRWRSSRIPHEVEMLDEFQTDGQKVEWSLVIICRTMKIETCPMLIEEHHHFNMARSWSRKEWGPAIICYPMKIDIPAMLNGLCLAWS
jgi:hypothetical protein